MSFWDNVKKFAQPYAEDEYDDEYEDEYMDDFDEPEEPVRRAPRRAPAMPTAPVKQENDNFGFNAVAPSAPVAPVAAPSAPVSTGFTGSVVNMNTNKQEVVLFRPGSFNDTSKAADDLRNRKAVIVNMENVDKAMARRVVDFLSGCVYAMDGTVKKIAQSAYLFCPSHLAVTGDLESMQSEVESYV